jgi:hypothetical protein
MVNNELEPIITDYIEKTRSVLPDGFETDDFLDELKVHIVDLLKKKIHDRPTENPRVLLLEVFEELGPPESVRESFREPVHVPPSIKGNGRSPELTLAIRAAVSAIVVLIAAIILYYIAEWDFLATVMLLSVIVVAEWIFKAWEVRKHRYD